MISSALERDPRVKELSYNGRRNLIDRFMQACNLSIRAVTSTNSQADGPEQSKAEMIRAFE